MDVGLHRPARIAEAVSALTLPPETTDDDSSPSTLPAEHRRNGGCAARLAGELRALVEEAERLADLLLGDEHDLDAERRCRSRSASSPANGAVSPSAIVSGVSGTGSPAARPSASAFDPSGSTATTRTPAGTHAAAIPETSPPPPLETTIVSTPGTSSRISSPTVPCAGDHDRDRRTGARTPARSPRRSSSQAVERGRRAVAPRGRPPRRSAACASIFAALAPPTSRAARRPPPCAAAHASACAWLPAETPITPRARSLARQRAHLVERAARLERAGALEQLRLQVLPGPRLRERERRRPVHGAADRRGCRARRRRA